MSQPESSSDRTRIKSSHFANPKFVRISTAVFVRTASKSASDLESSEDLTYVREQLLPLKSQ
ncbi:MAG: hypothetical protein L6R36_005438 [Xanthoria steineri]|nr:MAG: hypothetical protein L6R36_005438 [Xanthoria steineri]